MTHKTPIRTNYGHQHIYEIPGKGGYCVWPGSWLRVLWRVVVSGSPRNDGINDTRLLSGSARRSKNICGACARLICNYTVPSAVTNCAVAEEDKTFLIWEEYAIYKYWCRTAMSNTGPTSSVDTASSDIPTMKSGLAPFNDCQSLRLNTVQERGMILAGNTKYWYGRITVPLCPLQTSRGLAVHQRMLLIYQFLLIQYRRLGSEKFAVPG